MSLRTRLLLIFGAIVVVAVALVSYAVSTAARKAFQSFDEQRTIAIIGQFKREYELQGEAVSVRIAAIAASPQVRNMALALSSSGSDPAPYLNLASSLASEQQLDYLELIGQDASIISSAQWPARFGQQESWVLEDHDWNRQPAFGRYEETPQGIGLGLVAVRTLHIGERTFYVAGGTRVDSRFLGLLVLPRGSNVLLWLRSGSDSTQIESASGPVPVSSELQPVLDRTRDQRTEITRRVRLNDGSVAIAHTIPILGRDSSQPIAVLVVASDRRQLNDLQNGIRLAAVLVAIVGTVLSIIVSAWWARRLSRPIEELSSAAQDVAAGDWERKVSLDSPNREDEVARLVASFNEMTSELVRQRDRALQAERVAAWRELARRLAHELKNPLFPLQITVENLIKAREQRSPEFNEIFAESTTTLLAELGNLRKIVGRFSDFSKMPTPQLQKVNLNRLLEESVRLFTPQLAAAANPIELQTSFTPADASVGGDADLLRRAFENLVLNAIDAMPQGGLLKITTTAKQNAVQVEISDTGAGLTEEEKARLFTPYYTTKQHGTGLGLAIVQSVISDHGASIGVVSRPGMGTSFRMEFQRR